MRKFCRILMFFIMVSDLYGQAEKMQAAFIYNFTMLVNWPVSLQSGDFVIAIVGNSPVSKELEEVARTKKAGSQTIVIKKINNTSEVTNAHIIFISNASKSKIPEFVTKTAGQPVLIVTENEGAAAGGSIINFVTVDEKLRFEVNEAKATARGLKLAATLLKLGIPVR